MHWVFVIEFCCVSNREISLRVKIGTETERAKDRANSTIQNRFNDFFKNNISTSLSISTNVNIAHKPPTNKSNQTKFLGIIKRIFQINRTHLFAVWEHNNNGNFPEKQNNFQEGKHVWFWNPHCMWKTENASKHIIRFKLKIRKAKKRTYDLAAEYNTTQHAQSIHFTSFGYMGFCVELKIKRIE